MTPDWADQEAERVCGEWLGYSHPYFPKLSKAIAEALRKTRADTIRELDKKMNAYCEKKVNEAWDAATQRQNCRGKS